MKVLHINRSDTYGGAGIAAYRLHRGLLAQGIDSRLLVGRARTGDPRVEEIPPIHRIEKRIGGLTQRYGLNSIHIMTTFTLVPRLASFRTTDILNFHNLHTGYFNYIAIPTLTKKKPALLTLHDMWSFTGHCGYSYDCDRWKTGCGKCPYPHAHPPLQRDRTHVEWKLKRWVYHHSELAIVSPSRWLAEQARQSMLGRFVIHHIPYGIDTETYQPLDGEKCKSLLGIPVGKKVLMFGVPNFQERRKGGDLLIKALQRLPESLKKETFLLTMGEGGEAIPEVAGVARLHLGYVENDRLKAMIYSAADLFLLPTRADNLPVALQESMACGTPMVSFDVGGVPELVIRDRTGYLAKPEDEKDFSTGILELLEDERRRLQMSEQCRTLALENYSLDQQARRYIALYEQRVRKTPGSLIRIQDDGGVTCPVGHDQR